MESGEARERTNDTIVLLGDRLSRDPDLASDAEAEKLEIVTPRSVEDAVKVIQDRLPAVTIIEHAPPSLDGLQTMEAMRRADPELEVVIVAYAADVSSAVRALRAGAMDYLEHPMDLPRLPEVLRRSRASSVRRSTLPKLLLVEDHEPTRRRLGRILSSEGYRVNVAVDGNEGLALLQSTEYDIAIVDVQMPGKDGLTVLREVRAAGRGVEIIVTTGHAEEDVGIQALRGGAVSFLNKPLDLEHLLITIEKAIELRDLRGRLTRAERALARIEQITLRANRET